MRNDDRPLTRRLLAVAAAASLGMGLAACGDESEGPEEGATVEEVGEGTGDTDDAAAGAAEDEGAEVFADPESFVGEQVTVSGEVSEQIAGDNAFRIAGGSGDPLLVLGASLPSELQSDDVVQVTGTVLQVAQDTFEDDFGFAWDEEFAEFEGEAAIAATSAEVIEEEGN